MLVLLFCSWISHIWFLAFSIQTNIYGPKRVNTNLCIPYIYKFSTVYCNICLNFMEEVLPNFSKYYTTPYHKNTHIHPPTHPHQLKSIDNLKAAHWSPLSDLIRSILWRNLLRWSWIFHSPFPNITAEYIPCVIIGAKILSVWKWK